MLLQTGVHIEIADKVLVTFQLCLCRFEQLFDLSRGDCTSSRCACTNSSSSSHSKVNNDISDGRTIQALL